MVYLEQASQPAAKKKPKKKRAQSDALVIDQLEHTFVPHLVAIRSGSKIKFTNSDTANHNVRASSFADKNQFNVFTGAGGDYTHEFVAEKKIRPILLSCDIHPWMRGWIFVFDHPYFAVSDKRGKFQISAVPAGKHRLVVWQPDGGYRKTFGVDVKGEMSTKIEIKIAREDLKLR